MGGNNRILAILLGVLAGLVLIVGGLSAILLLSGGGKDASSSNDSGSKSGGSTTAATSGNLRLGGSDPISLDPAIAGDAGSATYIVEIFSGLMTLNPNLEIVPDLAESFDVSADGKVYTFKLRDNAFFHNGRQVKASDVKCSMERAASRELGSSTAAAYLNDIVGAKERMAGAAKDISGIEVIDDRTVRITIDQPKPYFLAKLTYPTAFVIDCQQAQSNPRNWTRQPNGTGPYKLREWRLGERIVLEANSRYHLGAPKVQQVVYELAGGSQLTRFENNELDVAGVSVNDIDRVRDQNNALNKLYVRTPEFSLAYIAFSTTTPPFDDPNVRRAFGLAIDRKRVADVTFSGMLTPATGILQPQLPGYTPDDKTLPFNPDEAKRALAASKYAGKMPQITLTEIGGGAEGSVDTQAFIEQWKNVLGVDVQIRQSDAATFFADVDAGKLQMFSSGWIMDYPDPENILDLKFYSKSSLNDIEYSNPQLDKLLEQARVERDPAARLKLYQDAEKLILGDAAILPLYFSQNHVVVNKAIKGWIEPPMIIPRLRFVTVER
ncbi:MAG TPA: peptide ABC transporter substrate-binding protein [Dehalococcoidia bacterium]|nr:peptide ABC transporter substrate-binding protein [Dehalococcoidia bacterium]